MSKRKKNDERQIWTIDAETDPFKKWTTKAEQRIPVPFIWGLYTGSGFHTFTTTKEMVDTIRDNDVIVYAHNGGKFDFHFFLQEIDLYKEVKIINGRLVSARIGQCEIRDSYSLLPEPLKVFGGKLDIDMRKLEPNVRAKHMPEIIRYLREDCVSLWDTITLFEQRYGRHLTQAGAAMAFWENISGRQAPKTDRHFFKRFSQFYHGGRVQCFERGVIDGPLQVYDINGAYARAMLDEHPYDPIFTEMPYPQVIEATDMVHVRCVSNGVLPFRNERGITTYPDDNISRDYYTPGHEILAGIETHSLRDVKYIHATRFHNLVEYSIYINHFTALRKKAKAEGNKAEDVFAKRLNNSLYGKFGANPSNYGNFMCVPWAEKDDYREEGYEFNGTIGPHTVLRRDLDPWQEHYINVATAASITSQVRATLWRGLHASHRPIYCDTDCIIAEASTVPVSADLGDWEFEGTASRAWIAGKKMYYLQGDFGKNKDGSKKTAKQATKGVRLEPKEIKRVAMGKEVIARSDAPTFTLTGKRGVYFQQRTIRMTAKVKEPA